MPKRHAGALRIQIPKRAIHGVSGRTGREDLPQAGTIHVRRQGLDLRKTPFRGLAIVIDGRAFPATALVAVPGLDHNNINMGLGTARDNKRPGNRPAFNSGRDFQVQGTSGSGFFSE